MTTSSVQWMDTTSMIVDGRRRSLTYPEMQYESWFHSRLAD